MQRRNDLVPPSTPSHLHHHVGKIDEEARRDDAARERVLSHQLAKAAERGEATRKRALRRLRLFPRRRLRRRRGVGRDDARRRLRHRERRDDECEEKQSGGDERRRKLRLLAHDAAEHWAKDETGADRREKPAERGHPPLSARAVTDDGARDRLALLEESDWDATRDEPGTRVGDRDRVV
jgi:hypothetical protein